MRVPRLFSSYWFYAILVVLLVGVVSLIKTTETYKIEQAPPLAKDAPRIVMHKVNLVQFTPDGKLEFTINADGLAQFVDESMSASNALLVTFSDQKPNIFLRGNRADVDGPEMSFTGEARLWTPDYPRLLDADVISYDYDKKKAEGTNVSITLSGETDDINTSAKKMYVDLETNRMTISGEVTTVVEAYEK